MGDTSETQIRTNHDAWRAVRAGLRAGLDYRQIAARTGISYRMVGNYSRMSRPASIERKLNAHRLAPRLCECGRAMSDAFNRRPPELCGECRRAAVQREVDHDRRGALLLAHAEASGRVPTIREAMALIGRSRSVAAEEITRVFGPDDRDGAQRHFAPRRRQAATTTGCAR